MNTGHRSAKKGPLLIKTTKCKNCPNGTIGYNLCFEEKNLNQIGSGRLPHSFFKNIAYKNGDFISSWARLRSCCIAQIEWTENLFFRSQLHTVKSRIPIFTLHLPFLLFQSMHIISFAKLDHWWKYLLNYPAFHDNEYRQ